MTPENASYATPEAEATIAAHRMATGQQARPAFNLGAALEPIVRSWGYDTQRPGADGKPALVRQTEEALIAIDSALTKIEGIDSPSERSA